MRFRSEAPGKSTSYEVKAQENRLRSSEAPGKRGPRRVARVLRAAASCTASERCRLLDNLLARPAFLLSSLLCGLRGRAGCRGRVDSAGVCLAGRTYSRTRDVVPTEGKVRQCNT